jgi:hypothetical protein
VPNDGNPIMEYSALYKEKGYNLWLELLSKLQANNVSILNLEYNTEYAVNIASNNGVFSN